MDLGPPGTVVTDNSTAPLDSTGDTDGTRVPGSKTLRRDSGDRPGETTVTFISKGRVHLRPPLTGLKVSDSPLFFGVSFEDIHPLFVRDNLFYLL